MVKPVSNNTKHSSKKDNVVLYVEGGGSGAHSDALQSELRRGFSEFFSKTSLGTHCRPRVVACGGREQAFDRFQTSLAKGENALLLVDSEEPVVSAAMSGEDSSAWRPWLHLKQQTGWSQPDAAKDCDAHLMVQCMESWLLCDPPALAIFYQSGFKSPALPGTGMEAVAKGLVLSALQKATQDCRTKAVYGKGAHSFKLLALIDPNKVCANSPWAARLVAELERRKL